MTGCKACGGGHVEQNVLQSYRDDILLGAPFPVSIEKTAVEERCADCGHLLGISVPDLSGLAAAVAMVRAVFPQKLTGAEIKFLRKAAGWRAKDLAEKLGVAPETVSRWEHAAPPISEQWERHLRLAVCFQLYPSAPLAVEFDPDDLLGLKIRPVRSADDEIAIVCWREPATGTDASGGGKWGYREAA